MRDYAKVAPSFWTGETGRFLREAGRDVQLLALYLITGPSANMIGLYHLPLCLLCHHLGWTREGASKGLRRAFEGGFCEYDETSELIWIPEMAAHQIGFYLDAKDNRVKGVIRELEHFRKSRFYEAFYRRYRKNYNLPRVEFEKPLGSPSGGASKPLRSQEQEQEQDKEQEQEQETPPPLPPPGGCAARLPISVFLEAWNAVPQFRHCRQMTNTRLKHFRARTAEPFWLEHWQEALAKASHCPFCTGGGDRGWRADVDWFLRPLTVTRILEGKYDATGNGSSLDHLFAKFKDT